MTLWKSKKTIVVNKNASDYWGDMRMLAMIIPSLWHDEGGHIKCKEFDDAFVIMLDSSKKQWNQIEEEIRAWEDLKTRVYRYNKRKQRP